MEARTAPPLEKRPRIAHKTLFQHFLGLEHIRNQGNQADYLLHISNVLYLRSAYHTRFRLESQGSGAALLKKVVQVRLFLFVV